MPQQSQLITPDMTMGAIMERFPAAAEVMQSYGLQCIGCHVNPYESLEAGARGHGMTDDVINSMLNELNELAAHQLKQEAEGGSAEKSDSYPGQDVHTSGEAGCGCGEGAHDHAEGACGCGDSHEGGHAHASAALADIKLTPTAVTKLKAVLQEQGKSGWCIRVQAVAGGCAGYMYGMDFEQAPAADDAVVEQDDIKVVMDPASQKVLRGIEVDYVETLQQSGFKFNNPNATKSCGCGKSFH